MSDLILDLPTKKALQKEFIEALKTANLVILPADMAAHAHDLYRQQKRLLNLKALTPYQIAKFKLLPGVTSLKTVKNMITDGRINARECYVNADGKTYITATAVKRLRNE